MERVNITLDERGVADAAATVKRLEASGVQVHSVLSAIGIVSGQVDAKDMDRVRATEGVRAVEQERQFQLPPPESDLQ